MLRCALRWPRTIGGGSGSARATPACTFADARGALACGRGPLAGEVAAITDTIRKHGIAMPAPT
jgi:hypothetical protein